MNDIKITIGCVIDLEILSDRDLERFVKNIQSYISQVNTLYIYNRTSSNLSELYERFAQYPFVKTADVVGYSDVDIYREIAERAKEDGSNWFTMVYQGYFYQDEAFLELKRHLIEQDTTKISVLTPMPLFGCDVFEHKAEDYRTIKGCRLIGALVNLDIYNTTEGFVREYFNTTYDYDYCLETRSKGYYVILSQNNVLRNQDYQIASRKLFPYVTISMVAKDAMDIYYEARGRRYLWDKYKYIDPDYVKLDKKLARKEKREIWAKDKERKEKMRMYDKAIDDYHKKITGEYEE